MDARSKWGCCSKKTWSEGGRISAKRHWACVGQHRAAMRTTWSHRDQTHDPFQVRVGNCQLVLRRVPRCVVAPDATISGRRPAVAWISGARRLSVPGEEQALD